MIGGTAAVSRLLGWVDSDPRRFAISLNTNLLSKVAADDDWRRVPNRARLVQYLKTVTTLRDEFGSRIEVGLEGRELRTFERLCRTLGYDLGPDAAEPQRGRRLLSPLSGDDNQHRRRAERALGFNLAAVAEGLEGPRLTLELDSEPVLSPLDWQRWQAITGQPVNASNALLALAKDQRLSLILAGRRRMTRATRKALGLATWRYLYGERAQLFSRIASSIELGGSGGRLQSPGGTDTVPDWTVMVGASPREPDRFVRALFAADEGRIADLWHALYFLPDDVARREASPLLLERYAGKPLLPPARRGTGAPFTRPFARPYELAGLMRSLPATRDRGGDAGVDAVEAVLDVIASGRSGGRASNRARGRRPKPRRRAGLDSFREFSPSARSRSRPRRRLLGRLLHDAAASGRAHPAHQAIVRAVTLVEQRPSAPPRALVERLTDAARRFGPALTILDELDVPDEATVMTYLATLDHLDGLEPNGDSELLLTAFFGGTELLRSLLQGGVIEPSLVESQLAAWARLHRRSTHPVGLVRGQLDWLETLCRALPAVARTAPGRGPLERSLLGALAGPATPVRFRWNGLDYLSAHAAGRAAAMAESMTTLGVLGPDRLLAIAADATALAAAKHAGGADLLRTAELLARTLEGLPPSHPMRPLVAAIDAITAPPAGRRLARGRAIAERLRRALAEELAVTLLAPAYVVAIGDAVDNVLLRDPTLIRSHRLLHGTWPSISRDARWSPAERVRPDDVGVSFVLGHPAGVSGALAELHLRGSGHGQSAHETRDRLWREAAAATPWRDLDPELSALTARLIGVGGQLVESAVTELSDDEPGAAAASTAAASTAVAFVLRRVPRARLESRLDRGPLVSPSELLALGLAAREGDRFGPPIEGRSGSAAGPAPAAAATSARASLDEATSRVGRSWRRRLDAVATRTTALDGRVRPRLTSWPPYEAVEAEWPYRALFEREYLDLQIVVVDYLGRHRLPGEIGADLIGQLLTEMSDRDAYASPTDWEAHIRWINQMDDAFFEERIYRCLRAGLYTQDS